MSYCTRGRELLLDLKRSAWLPPYDDEGVRIIINEVDDLTGKLESMIESGGLMLHVLLSFVLQLAIQQTNQYSTDKTTMRSFSRASYQAFHTIRLVLGEIYGTSIGTSIIQCSGATMF
jgi:uncharacterized membrane protein